MSSNPSDCFHMSVLYSFGSLCKEPTCNSSLWQFSAGFNGHLGPALFPDLSSGFQKCVASLCSTEPQLSF